MKSFVLKTQITAQTNFRPLKFEHWLVDYKCSIYGGSDIEGISP